MITEILLRHYTPKFEKISNKIANIIRERTDLNVVQIDHTDISLDAFDLQGKEAVSIDRYLSEKFNLPYLQVSRIFTETGDVIGRRIQGNLAFPDNACVIDTDMVEGNAIKTACKHLDTTAFSVPIIVKPHQDLIDVEDLLTTNSLLQNGENCSYLHNETFFAKRTSLPASLYVPMRFEKYLFME